MLAGPPLPECVCLAGEEEGAEDGFVVAGDGNGEIDVEVGGAVFGVAGGDGSEGAMPLIAGEDEAFKEDEGAADGGGLELAEGGADGNGEDAEDEEEPDGGVKELDGAERRHWDAILMVARSTSSAIGWPMVGAASASAFHAPIEKVWKACLF